ncbi:Fc receptor-like protein 5 [Leptodactylus fuscus]
MRLEEARRGPQMSVKENRIQKGSPGDVREAEDTENPDVDRPVVSFTPDWRTMFYNETLTISCLHPSTGQENETYTWYRNDIQMDINQQNFTISSIQLYDRANYKCKTRNSVESEPVRPHVITDLTILRVSRYVFEGDILNLTCDSRLDMNITNAQALFSKNYQLLKPMNEEPYLFVGKVDKSLDGKYKCTKKAILKNEAKETDHEETIEVTELFSPPEIKINSDPILVGQDMTLTCVTTLHPLRADTQLQFAFYRNGWHVQEFSSSKQYIVQSVQVGDSGDYSCEVRTIMNGVRKMSQQLLVLIQESVKPGLIIYPNWDKVLRHDQVTMTCNDQKSKRFSWYKDNVQMSSSRKTLMVYASGDKDIGRYQCQGESGEKSIPIHLDVFFVWLILQAPVSIHEGDSVTLKCRKWNSGSAVNTTFYKDEKMIQFLGSETDLSLGIVNKNATGKYKCTRFINTGSVSKIYTAEEYISVIELFTDPEIRVNLHPVVEGADMTLTCHTTISALRQSMILAFAFYKNGKIVQNFSKSNKYKRQSAQLEDSGSYTCEVKSSSNTVKKVSKAISINVQGMAVVSFTPNFGKILTKDTMTLTCNVDPKIKEKQEYSWYKDGTKMKITQQSFTIREALVGDSGYYQCGSTNTHMSEPLRLDVSNSNIVVQVPPFILEGDDLTLTCRSRQGVNVERTEFYKDGDLLKRLDRDSVLPLGKAYFNTSGRYKCTKKFTPSSSIYSYYSTAIFVPVTEIFTYLVLKLKSTPVIEGNPITLSCDVALNSALNPFRGNTKLEFAFYKDGQKIQDYGELNTYQKTIAMVKDSGNYTCNVKYAARDVVRNSQELEIKVEELFSTPVFSVSPANVYFGNSVVLTCDFTVHPDREETAVKSTIYKNGKVFEKRKVFRIFSAKEQNSGEYMCEAADSTRNVIKYSKAANVLVEEQVFGAKISADQQDTKILAGGNITFTCSVKEGTSLVFTWMHNLKVIDQTSSIYQVRQDGRVLFIESLQKFHSGVYQCKANNHFSSSESNEVKVTVIEPIGGAFLSTDKKIIDLLPEDSFTFTCSLTQGNGSNFLWLHNENPLKPGTSTYEFREGGKVLHIKSAQPQHEGSYQCRVEKDISSGRTLVSKSGTLTLKVSSKGDSCLKTLIIVMVVASILLIGIIVYKYQDKLYKPQFLQGKPQTFRVSAKSIDDKDLLMDNMETNERISNFSKKLWK